MKLITGLTVLGVTLMSASMTSVHAAEMTANSFIQEPQLLLAEGGSDRVLNQQPLQVQRSHSVSEDDSQWIVLLVEEHPTAAGTITIEEVSDNESARNLSPSVKSGRQLYDERH